MELWQVVGVGGGGGVGVWGGGAVTGPHCTGIILREVSKSIGCSFDMQQQAAKYFHCKNCVGCCSILAAACG